MTAEKMGEAASISVVIPAYRVTPYIAQTLRSVLEQTRAADEVIVVNDGCPDTTALEAALEPFRKRIRYLKRSNGGPAAARNTGIQAARSELIAFLDGDDYWAPEFLEKQARYLTVHPEVDLVYSDAFSVRDDGAILGRLMERTPSAGEASLRALLAGDCTVLTTTVVVRRRRLEAAGLFDETVGNYSEDFDLWLRIAHSGGVIGYQWEALAFHRVHQASLTAVPLRLPRGALLVLGKASEQLQLSGEEREALERRMAMIRANILTAEAKRHLLDGDFAVAHQKLTESSRYAPTRKRRFAALLVRLAPRLVRRSMQYRA